MREKEPRSFLTGDVNQIDTPYLDENSNGLSYIIDKLQGNHLFAHVKLEKGERSELANLGQRTSIRSFVVLKHFSLNAFSFICFLEF